MKRVFPLAIVGAAVGALALVVKRRKQEEHIDETIQALDELSDAANDTVERLASEVVDTSIEP